MKVLTVVSDLGRGGTQRVAVDVARCYREHGHESAVLTRRGGGDRERELIEGGVEVIAADCFSECVDTEWNRRAREWGADLIHFHRRGHADVGEGELIRFLRDGRVGDGDGVRVIEHSHFGRCDRSADRELFDAHIQISQWCMWRWQKWARGLRDKPVGVCIPHMVDADRFYVVDDEERSRFRGSLGIGADDFVFGYIAQPHVIKWSRVLFESFRAVAERDRSVYLLIGGVGERSLGYIANFPEHIRSRIVVLPFLRDDDSLRVAYSAMDTFVHTTRIGETFGLNLTESMCCQTPVATMETPTHDNAQAEIVGHMRGGIVAANPLALVEGMELLREDDALRERCGVEGRRSVVERFGRERVGEMLMGLAKHVHESHGREELRERIEGDPLFLTSVSDHGIGAESGDRLGSHSISQRAMQVVVLNPVFQRVWRLKHKSMS